MISLFLILILLAFWVLVFRYAHFPPAFHLWQAFFSSSWGCLKQAFISLGQKLENPQLARALR